MSDLKKIREESLSKLRELDDKLIIYPGHDYGFQATDTLGSQKSRNRYLSEASKPFFIRKRMASKLRDLE